MGKQSAFAKAVQREVNIQLQLYGRNRMQLAEDAAFMAANEVLGLGSGRARAFGEAKVFRYRRLSTAPVGTWQSISAVLTMKTILPPLHLTCLVRCLWKTQGRKCWTCR